MDDLFAPSKYWNFVHPVFLKCIANQTSGEQ